MKHYKILFAVFSATSLSFVGWFTILQTIDPFSTDSFSRIMFYVFALIFLWGVFAMCFFYLRKSNNDNEKLKNLFSSIRQGLVISIGFIGLAVLRTIDVLNLLSASVYVIALILIEFYYSSKGSNYA